MVGMHSKGRQQETRDRPFLDGGRLLIMSDTRIKRSSNVPAGISEPSLATSSNRPALASIAMISSKSALSRCTPCRCRQNHQQYSSGDMADDGSASTRLTAMTPRKASALLASFLSSYEIQHSRQRLPYEFLKECCPFSFGH